MKNTRELACHLTHEDAACELTHEHRGADEGMRHSLVRADGAHAAHAASVMRRMRPQSITFIHPNVMCRELMAGQYVSM